LVDFLVDFFAALFFTGLSAEGAVESPAGACATTFALEA
jgi:hypothetical protein